jgi:hypothetical protein
MELLAGAEPRDLLEACASLFSSDLGARSEQQLADDLRDLQQLRNLLDGELLRRLGAFDARGGAGCEHSVSTKAWLRGVLHLSPSAASGHVAVARRLRDEGPLALAAACGDVSYEHCVVIERAVATVPEEHRAEAEAVLADTARFVHPSDLRTAASRIREAVAPESLLTDQEEAHERRYLDIAGTFNGMVSIQGMVAGPAGDHLLALVAAYAKPLGPDDARTATQRRADALIEVVKAGLESGCLPETGGEKPHVSLTLDVTPLLLRQAQADAGHSPATPTTGRPPGCGCSCDSHDVDDGPPGSLGPSVSYRARLSDGTALVGPALDELLCDVSIHRVITLGPSEVLDIGRRTRLWPAAIRRAAATMYDGCGAHGCDRPPAFTDLHHVVHWKDGGETSLANGIPLCRVHHGLVHTEEWAVVRFGERWIAVPSTHPLAAPPPPSLAV